ncbi:MAG: succinate--CoA ligase subunit alpha [Chloroflexi bacterium]|nr:succinate--CoA ligase subunit alpha [Chloroflexota bacterium]|tara:strand:- start:2022 stop:2894 length:873 start_codon:yes stop_codon:yes gene_type:complete
MSILIDENTKLLIQGVGKDGSFQALRMLEYGTNIVSAVHPGKEGKKFENKIPYFSSVNEAIKKTNANVGVIFVPAPFAKDAIIEQIDSGLELIVCITEGIPIHDMVQIKAYLINKNTRLLGPNCPGIITPESKTKVGIIPGNIVKPGNIGVVSRSGTLTYEAISQLVQNGFGQSTCVGIGGDPINGTSFVDILKLFEEDKKTKAIVLIGEIGGNKEQEAANFIKTHLSKPVIATIAGHTAPEGKRMGHAGAIVTGESGLASAKNKALSDAGVHVVESPAYIGKKVSEVLT